MSFEAILFIGVTAIAGINSCMKKISCFYNIWIMFDLSNFLHDFLAFPKIPLTDKILSFHQV